MATIPTTRPGDVIREIAAELRDEPPIARDRLAEAYRSRQFSMRRTRPAPTRRALSAEPCPYCQIPGRAGCDHFLPFEGRCGPPPKKSDMWNGVLQDAECRTGRRHPIYDEIVEFCRATGMTRTGVCREAGFNSALFTRIQEGATPSDATLATLRAYMDMFAPPKPAALHARIKAFCAKYEMMLTGFGRAAVGDAGFCQQLVAGREPAKEKVDKAIAFMRRVEGE